MWTAPGLQEVSSVAGRIACDHMSGLLTRSQMTAGQDGVRDASSKQSSGFERATGSHGVSRVLGSIDHAICSFSSKLPASQQDKQALLVKILSLGHCRRRNFAARMVCASRAGRAAKPPTSGAQRSALEAAARLRS